MHYKTIKNLGCLYLIFGGLFFKIQEYANKSTILQNKDIYS